MLNITPIEPLSDGPEIGSLHIHQGGNIWKVIRYANVNVHFKLPSGKDYYVNKGECIFLICLSSELGTETHWKMHEFREAFVPL
jgi:hypothetical protein